MVKGVLIGLANIIPGVSGGTFALILGIYDRLINALAGIKVDILKKIINPRTFIQEIKKTDIIFLIQIGSGAVISIVSCSWFMEYVLKEYPGIMLSLFMGLIVPSVAVPYRMISKRSLNNILWIIPGIILVLALYSIQAGFYKPVLPVIFLSGVFAVSAMILPGISGSFLMLLMGVYEEVIRNIKSFTAGFDLDSFVFLSVFAAGCLLGLVIFVRLMKMLFNKYSDKTMFFLIGLVIGSFVVLWPFKEYPQTLIHNVDIAVITSKNRLPVDIKEIAVNSVFFVLGLVGSWGLIRIAKGKDK
ncbi:DUF368 domain-containing protein [Elusimicrobiota bacterium]